MNEKNLSEFKSLIESREQFNYAIKINIESKKELDQFISFLGENNIENLSNIDRQIEEYREIHDKFYGGNEEDFNKKIQEITNSETGIIGELIYLNWANKAVYNVMPEDYFYELITWRNKEKITHEEQQIISNKSVGIIGCSVGSFTARVVAKLGFRNLKIAELKNMKPSNAPRMYHDSLRNYNEHKVKPLEQGLYEFNPYINLQTYYDGVTKENIEDFFRHNDGKIDILIDAADDGAIKILMRQYCKEYKIPLVYGFDEKGALLIMRYDLPELLGDLEVDFTIEELAKLKEEDSQAYVYKLLDFFPGGADNITQRQKDTIQGINEGSRGGFSQLAWEASLFASYVAKATMDIALGEKIHGVKLFDLDELITKDMKDS